MRNVVEGRDVPVSVRPEFFLVGAAHGAADQGSHGQAQRHPGDDEYQKDDHTVILAPFAEQMLTFRAFVSDRGPEFAFCLETRTARTHFRTIRS